jgi:glycosyltransferase involved in cell wall biosynthesis
VVTCSIVLATFNGARYLPQQLESIRVQARPPDELIVSDDGSSDDTRQIVASFATGAPFPVRVLDGPEQGCAENFWTAAKVASGDVIAWSDQDDVWHPDKLRLSLEALATTHADMVSHAAAVVGPTLEPLGRRYPSYSKTRVLDPLQGDPLHVPSGFASAFRRSLLAEIAWDQRPQSHQHRYLLPHDHSVSLIAFACHKRVELADVLAQYRQHGSNLAGAPKASGLSQQLRGALRTSGADYQQLAERLFGYAAWLEGSDLPEADRYFRRFGGKALSRSQVRTAPRISARCTSLGRAIWTGAYRSPYKAGFGTKAFANDVASLSISTLFHPSA